MHRYWCAGYLVPYALMLAVRLLLGKKYQQQGRRHGSAGRSLWHLQGCTPALWALFAFVVAVRCTSESALESSVIRAAKVPSHVPGVSIAALRWRIAQRSSSIWPQQMQRIIRALALLDAAELASGTLLVGDAAAMLMRRGTDITTRVVLIGSGAIVGLFASVISLYFL